MKNECQNGMCYDSVAAAAAGGTEVCYVPLNGMRNGKWELKQAMHSFQKEI